MSELKFITSPEVQYACTLCGECCQERWRVPIDEATQESLKARDWSATPLAERFQEDSEFYMQAVPTLATGGAFATECGACVLLGEDGLCSAHRYFGSKAKGIVCRLFPFLFVEAPEGIYTGYSFCCRPVRNPAELKTAETVLEESPAEIFAEACSFFPGIHYQQAPAEISLGFDVKVSWVDYLKLESALLEILSRKEGALASNLVAGYIFLTLAGLFLREFHTSEVGLLSEKVDHFIQRMREENFARVDQMARRVRGRGMVRRYVLSVMLGLHEAGMKAREKRDQAGGGPGMISRFSLIRSMLGRLVERYPKAELPQAAFDEAVGRYLRHVIWRKGLAMGRSLYRLGGLTREYAMLLINYSLIEYFAKKLAPEMGPEAATIEAIRQVERDFVLHAGRDEIGPAEEERDTFELFLGMFDSLVRSKSFAPSMVGKR